MASLHIPDTCPQAIIDHIETLLAPYQVNSKTPDQPGADIGRIVDLSHFRSTRMKPKPPEEDRLSVDSREIDGLMESLKSGDIDDPETVAECIRDIVEPYQKLLDNADDALARLRYMRKRDANAA